jgi:hypothetical protein
MTLYKGGGNMKKKTKEMINLKVRIVAPLRKRMDDAVGRVLKIPACSSSSQGG